MPLKGRPCSSSGWSQLPEMLWGGHRFLHSRPAHCWRVAGPAPHLLSKLLSQIHLLGLAAALELGLDLNHYQQLGLPGGEGEQQQEEQEAPAGGMAEEGLGP
jgi:hypothetical protein